MNPDPSHRAKAYGQAAELQQLIFADAVKPDIKPTIRAGLARAWILLEQLRRDIRGKRKTSLKPKGRPTVISPVLDRATAQPAQPTDAGQVQSQL